MFDLSQMAAILDFTHNAMSDHTTRSGIPENPIVDTKIMMLRLFCEKLYQLNVWPWQNGGHLGKWPISEIRCKLKKKHLVDYWR